MMTPSRIRSSGGAADYYSADDYYLEGEAGAPGIVWGGKGAADLGLSGSATKEELQAVLEGRNPDPTGPSLVSSTTKAKHHPGWDFTFAVPKSVTLAIIAADRFDPELAERLRGHVMSANAKMMRYLEESHAITRVREADGQIRQVLTGNLVYGSVMHITTRGGDPHIHVHNPIANTTKNPETGQYGAIGERPMFKWQKVTSLIGARALQASLMGDGYDIAAAGELAWEIAGIDRKLTKEFSTRSEEIDEKAKALAEGRGVDQVTAAQRSMIQKQTRKAKEHVDRQAISDDWYGRAEAVAPGSFSQIQLVRGAKMGRDLTPQTEGKIDKTLAQLRRVFRSLSGANMRPHHFNSMGKDPDRQSQELVGHGVRIADAKEAVNSKHLIMMHALQVSPPGVTFDRLKASFERMIKQGLVLHADKEMIGGVTTSLSIAREEAIMTAVDAGRGQAPPMISRPQLDLAFESQNLAMRMGSIDFRLGEEQRAGGVRFFSSKDRYSAIQGFAGVGKSTLFGAVKAVADDHNLAIRGISTQHNFVRELESVGLQAQTIESFLRDKERKIDIGGAALAAERASWARAFLVVDEASTLTNIAALRITRVVEALQIPAVRIAGDRMQLGGQAAGNPFKLMLDRKVDQVEIKTIVRQRHAAPHFREAVGHFAEGRVKEGLSAMASNIHELGRGATEGEVANKVVALWKDAAGTGATGIVVTTNKMRDLVSLGVRDVMRKAGQLKGPDVQIARLNQRHMVPAEQFSSHSYALGDVIVPVDTFLGRATPPNPQQRVVGIDHANNMLKVEAHNGKARMLDLNAEHGRRSATFSAYRERTVPVAVGDTLLWEARFKDRGYERGARFTITKMTATTWTVVHDGGAGAKGREETLSVKDPALSFTGYAYAQTADRAQGQTIGNVIYELTTKAGGAANQLRNYVMNSRMAYSAQMVTDDLPRVAQLLMENEGHKPVALDHLRGALDALRADKEAEKGKPQPELEKELFKSMDLSGGGRELEKVRIRTRTIGPMGMGGI